MTAQPAKPSRSRTWPRQWLLAWVVAGVLAGSCALAVVELGLYDVRATRPHNAIVAWATHTTMINSVRLRAGRTRSPRITPAQIEAGFLLYDAHCSVCHGAPAVSRAAWVDGMTPTPPYLVDAPRRWTPAQLHFIIAGGVKMTGMPGWSTTLSDRQVWDLVAFLDAMPYLSGPDYQRLRATYSKRLMHPRFQRQRIHAFSGGLRMGWGATLRRSFAMSLTETAGATFPHPLRT